MRINVKVKPSAGRNEIKKIDETHFEVKVTVPPEKGKANQRTIEMLAKYFKVPKSKINLIRGETYKEKVFEL
ncbi:MAG: DUF167 domain-containing protein [Ignavibacteria bacterium]|jgi:uncharacterized protein (TIGR00251 family)